MVNEVFDFYFRNYTTHFGKPTFRDALASIPQVMVWDDHDIFDGWGSYPEELQRCPVFLGVFFVARKFYLLFQCHAAESNYRELNKGWGLTGLSCTVMLGNTTAVVGLDSRGERSRSQIIRPASWAAFSDQVAKLPAGVRHVVVLATVPLVYPTVPGIEEAMMALAGTGLMVSALTAFLQKTGLSSQIYSQFGEPELLDDLLDHWSARPHEVEKYCFVRMMQDLAKARGFRFSILSGDVHCAGVAAFQTIPKINLKADHRYMVQVISSAIGNVPPPDGVIAALTASNKPKMLDPVTKEKMRAIFENNSLLKASRNWCDIHERPLLQGAAAAAATRGGGVSGGVADGSLVFQLRVEHPVYKEVRPYTYDIVAPLLELPSDSFSPGPLPVAPPLPPPLMLKFQEELVAAGVGMEAAMPLLRQGAAPAVSGSATITSASAAMAPSALPQVPAAPTAVASGTVAAMAPVGGHVGFGLQSDIDQHQQNRGLPPVQAPAPAPPLGGYGGMPPAGQTTTPMAVFYQPPPLSGSVPYNGGPAQPSMYGGGAGTVPPPAGAPGMAYPPSSATMPPEYMPQPHSQQPGFTQHPPQPGYYPHPQLPQQGQLSYPSYYPPQHGTPAPVPYMPHGQAPYPQQVAGYTTPPPASYPNAPTSLPYGAYPGH
ncbi:hypothetical protein Vretifemale_3526 [Volvox reticuliferus]|nr:hypothetical protein Vretifemale_3526 [Volvox reticuliferus]